MRFLFCLAILLIASTAWGASGSDDFERSNANPLDGSWNNISSSSNLEIVSGDIRSTSITQDAYSFFTAFTPTANQEATITLAAFTGSGYGFAGAVLRGQDASNMYVCFAEKNTGTTSAILILNGGGFTTIASESSTTWAATNTLRCKVEGTGFNLYRNGSGSPLINGSDNTFSSGSVGAWITEESNLAQTAIEDFSAQDVSPPAAAVTRRRPIVIR